ncbi:MAG: hypothetical protein LJE70_00495 [Chromatiaceae bacterium]|jgi:ABC-type polar amino acid transport system ATPase subunit|nr:hypothetical protein [Chromatiaceae bacterium]
MNIHNIASYPTDDMNGLIAVFLKDVANQPVPRGGETRLAEIRRAVSERRASEQMIMDIYELFPRSTVAESAPERNGTTNARAKRRSAKEAGRRHLKCLSGRRSR